MKVVTSLEELLPHLAIFAPPNGVVVVGAGSGNGKIIGSLVKMAITNVVLVEANEASFRQLRKGPAQRPGWILTNATVAPLPGEYTFYIASLSSESGILDPRHEADFWPNISIKATKTVSAISLSSIVETLDRPANWYLIDCFPAVQIASSLQAYLKYADVIVVRVPLSFTFDLENQSGHTRDDVSALHEWGFRHAATVINVQPQIGYGIYIRDKDKLISALEDSLGELRKSYCHAIERLVDIRCTISAANQLSRLEGHFAHNDEVGEVGVDSSSGKEPEIRFSSAAYWEERYSCGGSSGAGSYGALAEFKARIINRFIKEESVKSIIEFGCGDGNQLKAINIGHYIGVDVSRTAVTRCKALFESDPTKSFLTTEEFRRAPKKGELALSLDVIFHLVEDEIYNEYLHELFASAEKYCVIYASNDIRLDTSAKHVRGRNFISWVERNIENWELFLIRKNDFPYARLRDGRMSSFSNFYFFRKIDYER